MALPGPPTLLSYTAGAQRHHAAFSWALNNADNAKNYHDWIWFFVDKNDVHVREVIMWVAMYVRTYGVGRMCGRRMRTLRRQYE